MPKATERGIGGVLVKSETERKYKLAVNLFDIGLLEPTVRDIMLGGKISLLKEDIVWVNTSRLDETAVLFTCDLVTAAALLDVIRSQGRNGFLPLIRAYINRNAADGKGSWSRLVHTEVLTVVENGKVKLNPDIFLTEKEFVPGSPLTPKRVILTRSILTAETKENSNGSRGSSQQNPEGS